MGRRGKRVIRWWAYFKRAHSHYLVFILSFVNFITITYTLLFVELLHFPKSPLYFAVYSVGFVGAYFIVAVVIGRWDYRKGTVPVEMELHSRANPWTHDLAVSVDGIATAIELMVEGRDGEALEVLRGVHERLRRWK